MVDVIGTTTGVIGACDVVVRASLKLIEYISEVRSAPRDIERLGTELEALEAVASALQGFLKSTRVTKLQFASTAPIAVFVEKCQEYIVELERKFAKHRARSHLLWPISGKSEIEKTIRHLHRFTQLFHLALSTHGWSHFCKTSEEAKEMLTKELHEWEHVKKGLGSLPQMAFDVEHIDGHCEAIRSMLDMLVKSDIPSKLDALQHRIQAQEDDAMKKDWEDLLEWVSKDDFLQKHRHVRDTRHEGTGTWVTDSVGFQQWLNNNKRRVLWCYGIPGCGKTIMFSAMVEYITSKSSEQGGLVAAVYFDYKDNSFHDVRNVLAGILRQLVEAVKDQAMMKETLHRVKQSCSSRGYKSPTVPALVSLFQTICQLGKQVTLCFDALDEIPDSTRVSLMKCLADISLADNLRILLMSRPHLDIRPRPGDFIECEVVATDTDLETFLHAKLDQTDSQCLNFYASPSSPLRGEIISRIISKSRGMFLLADLHMAHLEEAVSAREIRDLLQSLPNQIEDQYHSYLSRIQTRKQGHLALRAISWIHYSGRPLTSEELLVALSVREGDRHLDPMGLTTIATILNLTGGLLTYEEESKIVRLVHETLQNFLNKWHSILPDSHLSIAKTLQTYLEFDTFSDLDTRSREFRWVDISRKRRENKLLDYSFHTWHHHIVHAGSAATELGLNIAARVCNSIVLTELISSTGLLGNFILSGDGFLPLHIATLARCHLVVLQALKAPLPPSIQCRDLAISNIPSKDGLTSLHIAAIANDAEIARLLVENGASISIKDHYGRTALYHSAINSNQEVLVYVAGLDTSQHQIINTPDADAVTPVHAALRKGHTQISKQLIELNANIHLRTKSGQTPLHFAVQFAPTATDILVGRGASLEETSSNGRNALLWACSLGDEKCISILLRAGANPCTQDDNGETPLHLLAKAKTEELDAAKLLLGYRASLDEGDCRGRTPLHVSIKRRHFAIADLFILHGADVRKVSKSGISALHIAAAHADTPDKLWSLLGDPNNQFKNGQSALHLAAKSQNVTKVENLLTHGAKINLRNAAGETALHLAVRHYIKGRHQSRNLVSKSDVVRILLNHGADANICSKAGMTPIHEALLKDSVPLVQLLCSFRPDLTVGSTIGQSPIRIAIKSLERESLGCLGYLLQSGADPNEQSCGTSPLVQATEILIDQATNTPSLNQNSFKRRSLFQSTVKTVPRRRNSMTMDPVKRTEESALLDCLHHGDCEAIIQLCAKIQLLLSFGADPQANVGSTEKLVDFIRTQVLGNSFLSRETSTTNTRCDEDLYELTVAVQNPQILVSKRAQLDLTDEFEWDDTISLLEDTRRSNRRRSSHLLVPTADRYSRASATSAPTVKWNNSSRSFRRPTEFGTGVNASIRSYDRMRRTLLKIEEDSYAK